MIVMVDEVIIMVVGEEGGVDDMTMMVVVR